MDATQLRHARRSSRDALAMMKATLTGASRWEATRELREWSGSALASADSVLDAGCGLADVLIALAAAHSEPGLFVGVDSNQGMISAAQQRAAEAAALVSLTVGDICALDFEDNTFAATRAERVLQWLPDPALAVSELVRVTRPGGTVVLIDTDWRTMVADFSSEELSALLREAILTTRPSPSAGGRLASLARDAGLGNLRVRAAAHVVTDVCDDGSDGFPPISAQVAWMHSVAGLDAEVVDSWCIEATSRIATGDFFATMTLVAVVGTVPR